MKRREFFAASLAALPLAAAQTGTAMEQPRASHSPARVLVISAHPGDYCSRAGGTLIAQVKAGSKVKVIWLTHGETNEAGVILQQHPGISLPEIRRIREAEAFASAKVIGAEGQMMGWGDNPLIVTPERMQTLARDIADFKPDIILTHWKNEVTYATHWLTSKSAIEAAQLANGSWDIRFFEPTIGTATRTGFVPDEYVDITDVFDQKVQAMKTLTAQPWIVEYYTTCNRMRGLESGRHYAEAFVRWAPRPVVQALLNGPTSLTSR